MMAEKGNTITIQGATTGREMFRLENCPEQIARKGRNGLGHDDVGSLSGVSE